MHLGVTGMLPDNLDAVTEQLARKIAELGFSGVGMHLAGSLQDATPAICQRARSILEQHGIQIIQLMGFYPCLISPDPDIRRAGIRKAQDIIAVAARLGSPMVGIRPTSLNPNGDWWPHPDNYAAATEDRLVESLREIAIASAEHGIPIALECHAATTLCTAEAVRRVIERTQSNWVKVNMDPVNFIKDFHEAYYTTALVNELFDVLGEYIVAAHVKDVYVEDRHVVHISETIPGDGLFDFETFFRRFQAVLPDGYAFIEHLPEAQIPQAAAFVLQKLRLLKIPHVGSTEVSEGQQ